MKSISAILISIIMCSALYAQQDSTKSDYAITFGIADNFRLDKFNMDFAVKKILDDKHQLRLMISPSISGIDSEQDMGYNSTLPPAKRDDLSYSISLAVDYFWYPLQSGNVFLYTGPGLSVSFEGLSQKSTNYQDSQTKIVNENETSYTGIGIRGILGAEWKVTENIGIHSEYLFTGSYGSTKEETKSNIGNVSNKMEQTRNRYIFRSVVLFGVSIYL